MKPDENIERIVARLHREAKNQVDLAVVHCAQHGPQYACVNAQPTEGVDYVWLSRNDRMQRVKVGTGRFSTRCKHISCIQIANKHCPECEAP